MYERFSRSFFTPFPLIRQPDIELTCYSYEGIDAIKAALRSGLEHSTEALPIKINLIAPPLYVVTTTSLDKDAGVKILTQVIESVNKSIKEKGGAMNVKMAVSRQNICVCICVCVH